MSLAQEASADPSREIVVTRVLAAPRPLVFDAWTDAEHISNWWGPRGFTTTTYEMDARPGGRWRFTMHGPDGTDYPNEVVYRELVRPEWLAYAHSSGAEGDPGFQVSVRFEEVEGGTRVTLRLVFSTAEAREQAARFGAVEGGHSTLERLEEHLRGQARRR